jgi:hypothetical protein
MAPENHNFLFGHWIVLIFLQEFPIGCFHYNNDCIAIWTIRSLNIKNLIEGSSFDSFCDSSLLFSDFMLCLDFMLLFFLCNFKFLFFYS